MVILYYVWVHLHPWLFEVIEACNCIRMWMMMNVFSWSSDVRIIDLLIDTWVFWANKSGFISIYLLFLINIQEKRSMVWVIVVESRDCCNCAMFVYIWLGFVSRLSMHVLLLLILSYSVLLTDSQCLLAAENQEPGQLHKLLVSFFFELNLSLSWGWGWKSIISWKTLEIHL